HYNKKLVSLMTLCFQMMPWRGLRLGGEIKSLAAHLELMLINVGSRYPVSDFNHQPIRRLIQLIFRLKEQQ
ncbi:hypothetical protein, partial [Klebsiella pneumoniae]